MGIRKQIKDPLLGFGWAGYVYAAILIALIAALVAGVELRYELLKLILNTLGVDAMMYFVTRLVFVGFAIVGLSVSVTTGLAVLIAFKVAPYRISPLVQLVVLLLCTVWYLVPLVCARIFGISLVLGTSMFGFKFSMYYLIEIVGTVLIGLFVFRLSRSKFVAAMWTMAVALASINMILNENSGTNLPGSVILFYPFDMFGYTSLSLAFDILTMGSLILWAILERRKIVPVLMCHTCGYDLAGLPGDATCPECGHKEAGCHADVAGCPAYGQLKQD